MKFALTFFLLGITLWIIGAVSESNNKTEKQWSDDKQIMTYKYQVGKRRINYLIEIIGGGFIFLSVLTLIWIS